MKDITETNESPEKQITKHPEKKIDTFDDLKTSDNPGRIDTFDDIKKQGESGSIKTFDDLKSSKETGDKTKIADSTDKAVRNTSELTEKNKIELAAQDIKKNERMQLEKWKTLSIDKKRQALGDCGKELGKAYDSPEPPLSTKKIENTNLQGQYGDGYKYDASRDKYDGQIDVNPSDFKGHGIVGTDYGIRMNQEGMDPNTHKRLFGEDPREAVETYGHEFRHSYQQEQVQRYEKGFKVEDPEKAKEWSDNFKNYKYPPGAEDAKNDPEKYVRDYEAYRNQPVEADARDFGSKLAKNIYDDKTEHIGKKE